MAGLLSRPSIPHATRVFGIIIFASDREKKSSMSVRSDGWPGQEPGHDDIIFLFECRRNESQPGDIAA
jgi:hypothetical protein